MSTEIARTESTLAEQMEFARMVTTQPERGSQSILPEAYRGNPANVLIAVGLGQSMGLSQAESLYRIAVIKGKPTAAAELIASNVRKAGHRLRVTDGDATCTATIIRADDPDFEFKVTRDLKWAREMGLASNDNYKKQLLTMLQWRAISAVARLACPEALYGVAYVAEEIGDYGDAPQSSAAPKRSGMAGLRDAVAKADEPVDAEVVADQPTVVNLTTGEVRDPEPSEGVVLINPRGKQMKALHASMNEAGYGDRDKGLSYLTALLDREIGSTKELTVSEVSVVLDDLKGVNEDPFPDEEGQP
jgi:hypothetical protein